MQFHDGDKVKMAKGDETLHGVVRRGMDRAGLIVLRVEWGHGAISSWNDEGDRDGRAGCHAEDRDRREECE